MQSSEIFFNPNDDKHLHNFLHIIKKKYVQTTLNLREIFILSDASDLKFTISLTCELNCFRIETNCLKIHFDLKTEIFQKSNIDLKIVLKCGTGFF